MTGKTLRERIGAKWRTLRRPLGWSIAILATVTAQATTVVPPQFDQLVGQADFVVRAVVRSVTSELRASGPNRHIITKVELEVREVICGQPPQPLVLEMLGGQVGDEVMTVDGAPKFAVGDEDILFVHGNGRQFTPLVALMHGRYPIRHEAGSGREYMSRSDGSLLINEQDVVLPMAETLSLQPLVDGSAQALTPGEFVSRIKAASARLAAHPSLQK